MKLLSRLFGKKDRGPGPKKPGLKEPRPEDQFERMAMNLAFYYYLLRRGYRQYFDGEDKRLLASGVLDTYTYAVAGKIAYDDLRLAVHCARRGKCSLYPAEYIHEIFTPEKHVSGVGLFFAVHPVEVLFLNFVLQVVCLKIRADYSLSPTEIITRVVAEKNQIKKTVERTSLHVENEYAAAADLLLLHKAVERLFSGPEFDDFRTRIGLINNRTMEIKEGFAAGAFPAYARADHQAKAPEKGEETPAAVPVQEHPAEVFPLEESVIAEELSVEELAVIKESLAEALPEQEIPELEAGCYYEGEYKDGKFYGHGIYTSADGSIYEGKWENGKQQGKGILLLLDGSNYDGYWREGKRQGKGTFTWTNGDRYTGEWKNDLRCGKGVYMDANGNEYTGNWKDDRRHGWGWLNYANGSKYEGEWKEDRQHGSGTFYLAWGGKYEGEWKNGSRHGHGKSYSAQGDQYEGEWARNKRNGFGVYLSSDGDTYRGEWKDGKRHGKGKYRWANGDCYDGAWHDGKQHGWGRYSWADGSEYTGEWRDNQRHGKGTYISPGGLIKKGDWEKDVLLKESQDSSAADDQDSLLQRLNEILEEDNPQKEPEGKMDEMKKTMPRFDKQNKWLI